MEKKSFFIALLAFWSIHATRQESLCNKPRRPPPAGCCPRRYVRQCCPIAGDNETVYTCLSKSLSRSGSSTGSGGANVPNAITRPTFGFDYRTDCVHVWRTQACAGGFYLNVTNGKPEACPKGFFCPANLLCMIPCPSGAYCISKKKQIESNIVKCKGFGVCCGNNDPPLILNVSKGRKCKGVDDTNCICGGRVSPLPCPGGYYCPTPDVKLPCDSGHYCRPGSTEQHRCPWLTRCKKLSSAPITNFIAPLLNTIVLLIFVASLLIQKYWRTIRKYCRDRKNSRNGHGEETPVENNLSNFDNHLRDFDNNLPEIGKNLPKEDSFTIDIRFKNLDLVLKSGEKKGKVVLKGMTGELLSNRVTAVMGPSGSGKTTFLNAVSGKAYYGNRTGKITINNNEVTGIKQYRSITGFVPQEDTMHRNLTVQEVLYYQAKLRLPTNTDDIDEKITETLKILEISKVADSVIGDEEKKGISGGQRKRVNIGMELIADPTLLFLDEPTSGLDSTSSLSILKCLRKLAREGLTVVCVIHQPRSEIFKMFDNILLLGCEKKNEKDDGVGKIVYQGTVNDAKEYFKSLGFQPEQDVNPADYYMDVIGGLKKPAEGFERKNLFEEWKNRQQQEDNIQQNYTAQQKTRVQPGAIHQFITFTKREFKLQVHSVKTLAIDVFLVFFAGAVLGALYIEVTLGKFTALTRMSGMAIGLTAILSSLRCFGTHRATFWRESAAGVNRVSYFFAVNFVQIPILILMPLVYLSLLYTWASPRSYFSAHYAAVFCAQLCCSGIGYAISTIFNPKSSQMASVVIVLVMAMISGSSPTLCKMDEMTFFGPLGYNLSFIRWFVEALFEKEALRYPDVHRPQRDGLAFQDHYTLDGNYSFCLGVLVIMAVVYRLIALVFLLFTNRGKQQ